MLWFGREKGNFASSALICVSGCCLLNLLKFFISHASYILGAQKSRFGETILLRTHNMCYGLLNEKVILHQALLSVCLVDVNSIYISFFISHTSYILGAQKSRFSETVLLRTNNMCCGLVERKVVILHQTYMCVWLMFTQFP